MLMDKKKFARLTREGEIARAQALAYPVQLQEASHDHARRLQRVYGTGFGLSGTPLKDLAQWDRAALLRVGVDPADVAAAIESASELADLKAQTNAAMAAATAKAALASRLREFVRTHAVQWAK
jgi:hypothetical protein